jgi:hypothetical protein
MKATMKNLICAVIEGMEKEADQTDYWTRRLVRVELSRARFWLEDGNETRAKEHCYSALGFLLPWH